jgi:hypothetical protein
MESYIHSHPVAALRNFFRVFITKLKYNNITKKKNVIFRGLFCYYGLKQVLLFGLILLLWMLFELFFVIWTFYFWVWCIGLLDQGVYKLFEGVHNFI